MFLCVFAHVNGCVSTGCDCVWMIQGGDGAAAAVWSAAQRRGVTVAGQQQ